MITSDAFSGQRFVVVGLARSGLAATQALIASGAHVTAWDDRPDAREAAAAAGALIAEPGPAAFDGCDALVLSPGIDPKRSPAGLEARAAGVPIIGDIELFARARASLPPHRLVGVTGTNGKSTTTALIAHCLEVAGRPTAMGGNIGVPVLALDPLPEGGVYVLELSSYQIDQTQTLACDVAVLTNVTPDHLDRYDGDMRTYADAKERLFTLQARDGVAIIATDNGCSRDIAGRVGDRVWRVSALDVMRDAQAEWPSLAGPHNAENAAVARAALIALGLDEGDIDMGFRSFRGLPHRMERVAQVAGVTYVNDSKATNADATAPALAAFLRSDGRARLHWILGGRAKSDDLGACRASFGDVARAYVIGEAAESFAKVLTAAGVAVVQSDTLHRAVEDAAGAAHPGDVVLLSPSAASFDQFSDFEARGDAFRRYVTDVAARVNGEVG